MSENGAARHRPSPPFWNRRTKHQPQVDTTMLLPEHIFSLIKVLHANNLPLVHGDDEARRALQKKIVETTVARYPAEGWGWKKASDTRPPSKDAIANNKLMPGHLLAWDCFDGSTRAPARRDSETIDNQVFIELAGVDHLAGLPAALAAPISPVASQTAALPGRDEFLSALTWLDALYRQQLGRASGIDLEGIAAHIFDNYLSARLDGVSAQDARTRVVTQINTILGRADVHV